jgi:Predicted redox protein, regulator of disulfide bond formation
MSENASDVFVRWQGARQYEVSRDGAPPITLDGNRTKGPGPVEALLASLASCSAIDVIDYFEKRRTPVRKLDVRISAVRAQSPPRRVLSAALEFTIDGDGIDRDHAERSIALALGTYCSVAASLASDIALSSVLVLNGVPGESVSHAVRRGA